MAYSAVEYTASANVTKYTVPFPYVNKSHVLVSINGEYTTDYTWFNNSTIEVGSSVATGATIRLRRSTPVVERLVKFTDTSMLKAEFLDLSATQLLYVLQELIDAGAGWGVEVAPYIPGDVITAINLSADTLSTLTLAATEAVLSHIEAGTITVDSLKANTIEVDVGITAAHYAGGSMNFHDRFIVTADGVVNMYNAYGQLIFSSGHGDDQITPDVKVTLAAAWISEVNAIESLLEYAAEAGVIDTNEYDAFVGAKDEYYATLVRIGVWAYPDAVYEEDNIASTLSSVIGAYYSTYNILKEYTDTLTLETESEAELAALASQGYLINDNYEFNLLKSNYNERNDFNSTEPAVPEITSVTASMTTNGTWSIVFTWDYSGDDDEHDVDGFVLQTADTELNVSYYPFTTTSVLENTLVIPNSARSVALTSTFVDRNLHLSIYAYRVVDSTITPQRVLNGALTSSYIPLYINASPPQSVSLSVS